ncbi:hypothetical protein BN7_6419 [Wickerhamomyces ciferrii]|uniref:Uncharacterized protein n=1 Tax=Wickerhamomyces ciferrii (strain ATCC 14091 / BCRC 22168 / CBS 111 / JCM 3599 / NBRC 0793 / NRRL Y-1031 F-60-10) TaxID=1206466 RepID=K0KNJ9_WICCF|nr:uncharacterized protein BN7_6419 [Wickerhamomyces ciferrii]CCH46820.1 hypothetical protein BN7_6419 [Wickerhamomyces ciferrii]
MAHSFASAGHPNPLIEKVTQLIAGLETYAYFHKDKTNPFNNHDNKKSNESLKIVYLLHGRTSSAAIIEELAHDLITKYYKISQDNIEPIVIITFDFRNHGKRLINELNQQSWNKGNITHAADMISYIDGAVVELKTIHDYLPSFVPGLNKFKQTRYIVSGVSMGGHTTIQSVTRFPGVYDGAAPIVGCFDLSSLLLNRLGKFNRKTLYNESYGILQKNFDQEKYPRSLFDIVSKNDALVAHTYDTKKLKTFALFGEFDPLVLMDYSIPFLNLHDTDVKTRDQFNPSLQFQALKYNAEHEVTDDMTDDLSKWLVEF